MRVVMPGGTGQVGTVLARAFHAAGHEVIVLGRRPPRDVAWQTALWDARTVGSWSALLDGAGAVINLAGRNVNCRYTAENRRLIMESRVRSTQVVGEAIARASRPPRVWLQASTATIYAHRYDAPNDERTGVIGGSEPDAPPAWRFSIEVARACASGLAGASATAVPVGLPAPRWMVEIGTWLLRTESELVLKSRRVVAGRLAESGFVFRFPEWAEAARDLCLKARTPR